MKKSLVLCLSFFLFLPVSAMEMNRSNQYLLASLLLPRDLGNSVDDREDSAFLDQFLARNRNRFGDGALEQDDETDEGLVYGQADGFGVRSISEEDFSDSIFKIRSWGALCNEYGGRDQEWLFQEHLGEYSKVLIYLCREECEAFYYFFAECTGQFLGGRIDEGRLIHFRSDLEAAGLDIYIYPPENKSDSSGEARIVPDEKIFFNEEKIYFISWILRRHFKLKDQRSRGMYFEISLPGRAPFNVWSTFYDSL